MLRRLGLLSLLCVLLPVSSLAQKDPFANRLPAKTWLYLEWRGTGSLGSAKHANSLLRLWADPGFAPVRDLVTSQFYEGAKRNPKLSNFSGEDITELFSIFENPLAVGLIEREPNPENSDSASSPKQPWRPKGYFLVFDATGKVERLQNLYARFKAEKTEPITSFAVGPTTVDKIEEQDRTYYQAQVGNYFVRSDEIELLKELIPRFRSEEAPANSLAQTAEYQQARKQISPDALLEFFVRTPELAKMKFPQSSKFDTAAFLKALRVEQIRLACGSLTFAADGTRVHSAVLGDTSKGGLFDILEESGPTFSTLPLAPAGASYNVTRLNLTALYQLVKQAVIAATPGGATEFQKYEAVAQIGLGMSPAEMLQLFGGEFATIKSNPGDPADFLFAMTIHDQGKVVGLLDKILANSIATEDRNGETNYIELSTPYTDPQTGMQRRRFYSVAVTHDIALAAPHKAETREAVATLGGQPGAAPAGRLENDADFLRARASLPKNLTGMSYSDLTRVNWDKIYSDMRNSKGTEHTDAQKRVDTALQGFDPKVLSRYLRVLISGSWKDSSGAYFDLLLQ
jgi:hypothetical protein